MVLKAVPIERAQGNESKFTTTFHVAGRGSKCSPVALLVFSLGRTEEDPMSLRKACGQQSPLPPLPQHLAPGTPLLAHGFDGLGLSLRFLDFSDGAVTCDFILWKVIRCLLSFPPPSAMLLLTPSPRPHGIIFEIIWCLHT